ncbi:MAG: hypothetical protein SXQ77_03530 [Halobacteria archaeon]|nr:hypothetical protein [Halobacteria archaeon]
MESDVAKYILENTNGEAETVEEYPMPELDELGKVECGEGE